MKKYLLLFIMFSLLLLCSCGEHNEKEIGANSLVESEDGAKESVDNKLPQSVTQAFCSVFLNESTFFCTDKVPYTPTNVIHQGRDFLSEMPYTYRLDIVRFAVVDLDGDAIPEVVLELENYLGSIILRYREGEIYGNVIGYRSMSTLSLNVKGAFDTCGAFDDGGIEKMYFVGDTIISNDGARMTDLRDEGTFYVHDIISDKETWQKINDSFYESTKVEWYEYNEDEIKENIVDNPLFAEISTESSLNISERQQYLDSLSYLIDLTYDVSNKSDEEYRIDAQNYYTGSLHEMNRIYQLCQEKLSGQELEELKIEQDKWQENFDKRLNQELSDKHLDNIEELLDFEYRYKYYEFGDIILRRTLQLINIYYDCHFYDSLF